MVAISIRYKIFTLVITDSQNRDVDLTQIVDDFSSDYRQYLDALARILDRLNGRVSFGCTELCGRSGTLLLMLLGWISLATGLDRQGVASAYASYLRQYREKISERVCPETEFQFKLASASLAAADVIPKLFSVDSLSEWELFKLFSDAVAVVVDREFENTSGPYSSVLTASKLSVHPKIAGNRQRLLNKTSSYYSLLERVVSNAKR